MDKTDYKAERKKIEEQMREMHSTADTNLNIKKHLAITTELPDISTVVLYDYDKDVITTYENSKKVVESIVDLYLGDVISIKDLPYIKTKIEEDARLYGSLMFISEMTKRNYIQQMKDIDNGTNVVKMHEIVNQTVVQMRENVKMMNVQKEDIVKFYKGLRKEIGLPDDIRGIINDKGFDTSVQITNKKTHNDNDMPITSNSDDSGVILDNRQLAEILAKRREKNKEEK